MRIHRDERGQTIILVALSLPIILGFIGIATDVGALFKDKRTLQTAADAAAVAAAQSLNYGTYVSNGKAASAANGFTDGTNGVTVNISDPPTWTSSNYYNKTGYVEATVTKTESTLFLALFGHTSITVQARAVATLGRGQNCVYTLNPTDPPIDININNGAHPNFAGCGILDDSNSSDALSVALGSSLTASSIGIVSSSQPACAQSGNCGSPVTGIVPASDPLNYLTAPNYSTAGCGGAVNLNSSQSFPPSPGGVVCYSGVSIGGGATVTLNNGGVFIVNGDLVIGNGAHVTLSPGLYYITGTFHGQGGTSISGSGVTFYMAGTTAQIILDNGVQLGLSAPNAAGSTYNGILFWQASTDSQPITLAGFTNVTGSPNPAISGAIYAPAAQLNISNGVNIPIYSDLIVNSISDVGGSNIIDSYESLSNVAPVLTAPVLVE